MPFFLSGRKIALTALHLENLKMLALFVTTIIIKKIIADLMVNREAVTMRLNMSLIIDVRHCDLRDKFFQVVGTQQAIIWDQYRSNSLVNHTVLYFRNV
jgi:hypothetical protein